MTLPTKPRYPLLSDTEMDDRASAAMEQMFQAKRERRAQQGLPQPQGTTKPED